MPHDRVEVTMSMGEAPHLLGEDIAQLLLLVPEGERGARLLGTPEGVRILGQALRLPILSREEKEDLAEALAEIERRNTRRQFFTFYPDTGPLRRELYAKHIEFFAAGARYRERAFRAANRSGKSIAGSFEMTCHLTGLYPGWWAGRRFPGPVLAWAAGKTNETTRDIVQKKLLGEIAADGERKVVTGTGMIPGDNIGGVTWKRGLADFVDTVKVRHVSGGWSVLGYKSCEQGRGSFEGTERQIIWYDEEPPADVYGEGLIRTATTQGLVMLTFTPLLGRTEVVKSFLPGPDIEASHERNSIAG
jgi:phage terminase large subunit-like protein